MNEESYLLVPREFLESISENQKRIIALLEQKNGHSGNSIGNYIPESEAKKLLGKKTTWFWKMRSSGQLLYYKVGNKVFYNMNDIIKLVSQNAR